MDLKEDIFQDLVVVEVASALAGPRAGTFFKELGARVIKIENKTTGGDISRRWKLPTESEDTLPSIYYWSVNGKKDVYFLDLRNQQDYVRLVKFIKNADILITNFSQSKAIEFSVDYASVKRINPHLILANVTAFGPKVERSGLDVLIQAISGFLSMTGSADRPPAKIPLPIIDILTSHQLLEGILCALLRKEKTGRGGYVEVSLFDAAIASLANQASNYLMGGWVPKRMGSKHPNIAPYGDLYMTKDSQWVILAIASEGQFQKLCVVLGLNGLISDPKFCSNLARVTNRDLLNQKIQEKIKLKTGLGWNECFRKHNILAGSVFSLNQVFDQPEAKKWIVTENINGNTMAKRVKNVIFTLQ